jgi:hypothetical protein
MSFLGRHIAVDYSVLKDFHVSFEKIRGDISLKSSGTIMESAKVFESIQVKTSRQRLLVTVYDSLAFWNRKGSPDFSASTNVSLRSGKYEVWYQSPRSQPVHLGSLEV